MNNKEEIMILSERDAEVLINAIEEDREPNEKLKEAAKRYLNSDVKNNINELTDK